MVCHLKGFTLNSIVKAYMLYSIVFSILQLLSSWCGHAQLLLLLNFSQHEIGILTIVCTIML